MFNYRPPKFGFNETVFTTLPDPSGHLVKISGKIDRISAFLLDKEIYYTYTIVSASWDGRILVHNGIGEEHLERENDGSQS